MSKIIKPQFVYLYPLDGNFKHEGIQVHSVQFVLNAQ